MKELALVTVLYNSPAVLPDFFESLKVQTFKDFKLFIIDNSTNSESAEYINNVCADFEFEMEYINNYGNNVGVAAGNNQGIKKALEQNCEKVLLLNNDLIFSEPQILEKIIQASNLDHKSLISPRILSWPDEKVWYFGGTFNYHRGTTDHFSYFNEPSKFTMAGAINYAPTCFLLVPRLAFDDVGLMDEKYFAYYDDSDFVFRCVKQGWKVKVDDSLYIHHKVSLSTGGRYSDFTIYYGLRNRIYFIRKNYSTINKMISLGNALAGAAYRLVTNRKRKLIIKAIKDGFGM